MTDAERDDQEEQDDMKYVKKRLERERIYVDLIQDRLNVARGIAALYSMMWNIELAVTKMDARDDEDERDPDKPWETP